MVYTDDRLPSSPLHELVFHLAIYASFSRMLLRRAVIWVSRRSVCWSSFKSSMRFWPSTFSSCLAYSPRYRSMLDMSTTVCRSWSDESRAIRRASDNRINVANPWR